MRAQLPLRGLRHRHPKRKVIPLPVRVVDGHNRFATMRAVFDCRYCCSGERMKAVMNRDRLACTMGFVGGSTRQHDMRTWLEIRSTSRRPGLRTAWPQTFWETTGVCRRCSGTYLGEFRHEGAARRCGDVHGRNEAAECDAALAELVDVDADSPGETCQPVEVEVEGDEDITAAQAVDTGREFRVIGRGAGDAERVQLAVEGPTSFGGGATGVADGTHGMCPR